MKPSKILTVSMKKKATPKPNPKERKTMSNPN